MRHTSKTCNNDIKLLLRSGNNNTRVCRACPPPREHAHEFGADNPVSRWLVTWINGRLYEMVRVGALAWPAGFESLAAIRPRGVTCDYRLDAWISAGCPPGGDDNGNHEDIDDDRHGDDGDAHCVGGMACDTTPVAADSVEDAAAEV